MAKIDKPRNSRNVFKDQLTGPQKAAILCMVVGTETAAMITSRLSPDENEQLATEIAILDAVDIETVNGVMGEWVEVSQGAGAMAVGGTAYAREILVAKFGAERADEILRRISTHLADSAGLQRLRTADPQSLANTLHNEHPQVVAVVLANLESGHTAAIIKELGNDFGADVLYRMARLERVAPEMLQMIERSLRQDSDLELGRGHAAGGPEVVAGIINLLSGSMEKELIEHIKAIDGVLGEQIANLLFTFENIADLDDRSIQRLVRDVDNKIMAVALKAAPDELKERIMQQMPQRAVQALRDEMDMLGPTRMRDVEQAQKGIVDVVRRLEQSGEIVISKGEAQDAYV